MFAIHVSADRYLDFFPYFLTIVNRQAMDMDKQVYLWLDIEYLGYIWFIW